VVGFVSHTHETGGRGRQTNISVLVLNKATGGTVERADIVEAQTPRFRMYREEDDPNVLSIDMANYRIRLRLTDEAAAPEPPADDDVEGTRRRPRTRGVFGLFSAVSPWRDSRDPKGALG
jgi:hypothetical protein